MRCHTALLLPRLSLSTVGSHPLKKPPMPSSLNIIYTQYRGRGVEEKGSRRKGEEEEGRKEGKCREEDKRRRRGGGVEKGSREEKRRGEEREKE